MSLHDAVAAVSVSEYSEALSIYTDLIQSSPSDANLFLYRAGVQLKLSRYQEALRDVEKTMELGNKSEYARLHKAITLFHLGRFAEARTEFQASGDRKQIPVWLAKCNSKLGIKANSMGALVDSAVASSSSSSASFPPHVEVVSNNKTLAEKVPPFQHVITRSLVTITEYTKNVTRNAVTVTIGQGGKIYSIKVKMQDGSLYEHGLTFYAPVHTEPVQVNVNQYKVEIVLKKVVEEDWEDLETTKLPAGAVKRENVLRENEKASYPSSALRKANLEGVAKEVSEIEEEEKKNFDVFLKAMYKDSDEETRRAMIKSYQTSGGTVLNCNWGEVKDTDFEKKAKELVRS